MPLGYRIVFASSEADSFPAANLHRVELYRPWQTNEPQSKAVVELEFETPAVIKNIDLGNAGSAFVEIFVKNKDSDEFQVILPIASLMTFKESQTKSNRDRCKFFPSDKLSKTLSSQLWRRVRVVCTQPFVKDQQIGLSFLRFNVDKPFNPERSMSQFITDPSSAAAAPPPATFSSNPAVSSPDVSVPAPKAKAPAVAEATPLKSKASAAAAPAGAAEPLPPLQKVLSKSELEADRKRKLESERAEKEKHKASLLETEKKRKEEQMLLMRRRSSAELPPTEDSKKENDDDHTEETLPSTAGSAPKKMPLEGVVFVISAYVNPARAQIRDRAVELGATFASQWSAKCSHLISQYENTPKSHEALATGGVIVTKDWVDQCYAKKQRLPERDFGFQKTHKAIPPLKKRRSDSDEDDDEPPRPLVKKSKAAAKKKGKKADDEDESDGPNEYDLNDSFIAKEDDYAEFLRKQARGSDESDASGRSSDEEDLGELVAEAKSFIKDETRWEKKLKAERAAEAARMQQLEEDEAAAKATRSRAAPTAASKGAKAAALEQIVALRAKNNQDEEPSPPKRPAAAHDEEQSDHTEELDASELVSRKQLLSETFASTEAPGAPPSEDSVDLPDFFNGMRFYIHPDSIDDTEKRTLTRFVTAYGGVIQPNIEGDTTHVISGGVWTDYFATLQNDIPSLVFVKKAWVLACHHQQRSLPVDAYYIS